VLAIIKKSARAFDRRTGSRHPPGDEEGIFVLKYSRVRNHGTPESLIRVPQIRPANG